MPSSLKRLATPLLIALTLSGCASTKTPLVEPVRIPAPPAELMAPLPPSPVNVEQLLQRWTRMLESWLELQAVCKDTPQRCV